jgi:hypothetical protein
MSRLTNHVLVALYLALAILPAIAMTAGWTGRPIDGALPPAPAPEPSFDAVVSERFQDGFARWLDSHLGLRGNSIAFDNALLYHAFRETKPGAGVRVGKDGVLFNDDIDYYNKYGPWRTDPAYVSRMADEIADVQRRLRAAHRAFVPVIVPAKTSIWRDKIPDRWLMDLPEPRAADQTTRMVKQALDQRGVLYVDARDLFTSSPVPRADLYGPDARHWSAYGACLVMREVVGVLATLTNRPRLPYDCALQRFHAFRSYDDFDLWRLLNAAWVDRAVKEVPVVNHATPPPARGARPDVLFVGSSFCWQIMRDAKQSGVFRATRLNFYNRTFEDLDDSAPVPVEPGTARWREWTMDSELVVLDLLETYLGSPDAYVELFLQDLRKQLDAGAPSPGR